MSSKIALLAVAGTSVGGVGAFGTYKLINRKSKIKSFTEEEYQLIFKEFKSDNKFITSLKTKKSEITQESPEEEGGKAAREWCLGNHSKEAKKWCVQLPKTISEKIGKPLSSNWEAKIRAIKDTDSEVLLNDLKTVKATLDRMEDNQDSRDALKGWCESKWNTRLITDEDNSIYIKVSGRCVD